MKSSILLLIPLMLGLASCGENNTINNQEDVDTLKTLLAKQDFSSFNQKYYESQYKQSFSVYTNQITEDGKSIDFFNFDGTGNLLYFYDVDEAIYNETIEDEDSNIFDLMYQGIGEYDLIQSATINAYVNDEFEEKIDSHKFSYTQSVRTIFTEEDLQIENTYVYADAFDAENIDYRVFGGRIEKDTLFNSYSTKALTNILSRVNLYDGPGFCEAIDALYYDICLSLLKSSDKEISEFIIDNNIQFSESTNSSDVSFELKEFKYMDYLTENDVIPSVIKGTLHLDKDTHLLKDFDYKLSYFAVETGYNENYIRSVSMEFIATGSSYLGLPDEIPGIDEDITEYSNVDEFVTNIIEQVVPPIAE